MFSQFCTRIGTIAGPFDCWLVSRSIATCEVRVRQSCANAMALAKYLESRINKVTKAYYLGLSPNPSHEIAKNNFEHGMYGGMLSFNLKGGISSASTFVKSLSKRTLTLSLGDVRTTISHPGKTSHRHVPLEERKKLGITDSMIRVSVGIEDYSLIEQAFKYALDKV